MEQSSEPFNLQNISTILWKLNNKWVKEEITTEIIKYFKINENGTQQTKCFSSKISV
jgi:hypothetical protein